MLTAVLTSFGLPDIVLPRHTFAEIHVYLTRLFVPISPLRESWFGQFYLFLLQILCLLYLFLFLLRDLKKLISTFITDSLLIIELQIAILINFDALFNKIWKNSLSQKIEIRAYVVRDLIA